MTRVVEFAPAAPLGAPVAVQVATSWPRLVSTGGWPGWRSGRWRWPCAHRSSSRCLWPGGRAAAARRRLPGAEESERFVPVPPPGSLSLSTARSQLDPEARGWRRACSHPLAGQQRSPCPGPGAPPHPFPARGADRDRAAAVRGRRRPRRRARRAGRASDRADRGPLLRRRAHLQAADRPEWVIDVGGLRAPVTRGTAALGEPTGGRWSAAGRWWCSPRRRGSAGRSPTSGWTFMSSPPRATETTGLSKSRSPRRSRSSRKRLRGSPPPKPTRSPSAPTTRWHGTTTGSGLRPQRHRRPARARGRRAPGRGRRSCASRRRGSGTGATPRAQVVARARSGRSKRGASAGEVLVELRGDVGEPGVVPPASRAGSGRRRRGRSAARPGRRRPGRRSAGRPGRRSPRASCHRAPPEVSCCDLLVGNCR